MIFTRLLYTVYCFLVTPIAFYFRSYPLFVVILFEERVEKKKTCSSGFDWWVRVGKRVLNCGSAKPAGHIYSRLTCI